MPIKGLQAHFKRAILSGHESGNGDNIKFYFNTCLYHIAGIHSWQQDELTGPYTRCSHEDLSESHQPPLPIDSPPYQKLAEIVLNDKFQNDICKVGPYGGTSQCETKNALDRLYCPKDVYFPPSTYSAYVAMSMLHLNTLRVAELEGRRNVEVEFLYTRKFNDHPSRMVHKTPADHKWREEIRMEYIREQEAGMGLDRREEAALEEHIIMPGGYLEEEFPEIPILHDDVYDDTVDDHCDESDEDLDLYSEEL